MQKIRRAGYILVLIMAAALTTAFVWKPAPPARFTGLSSVNIPMSLDGYTGQVTQVDSVTKAALQSAEVAERHYQTPDGRVVDLTLIGGTDRSALHDPRSCLVGAGWKIDRDKVEPLNVGGKTVNARTCMITYADPTGGQVSDDVLYLYVTHKRVIASATDIRLILLESALLDQNDAPVYFLRFMAPLGQNQAYPAEHAALLSFASEFWKKSSPSILKGENS